MLDRQTSQRKAGNATAVIAIAVLTLVALMAVLVFGAFYVLRPWNEARLDTMNANPPAALSTSVPAPVDEVPRQIDRPGSWLDGAG